MTDDLLGNYHIELDRFKNIDEVFKLFSSSSFKKLTRRHKHLKINSVLCELILNEPHESFLLGAVNEYISRINENRISLVHYHINQFEFWLYHYSELAEEVRYLIRGKIAGRYVPREEYQVFFPLGMGKTYPGTHFVVAHLSPDVDTTIASFWGWVDAFSAKVGNGLHVWSLPGGPPESPTMQLFKEITGSKIFENYSNSSDTLTLNTLDLVTKENLIKEQPETLITNLDHGYNDKAIILVDKEGHYLGDWRSTDVEPVRQVMVLIKSCLHWLENHFHIELISLFSTEKLHTKHLHQFFIKAFEVPIRLFDPVKEFSDLQKQHLEDFLVKVMCIESGLNTTASELAKGFADQGNPRLLNFIKQIELLQSTTLFAKSGAFIEDRPAIFQHLQNIFNELDTAIHLTRNFVERLGVVMSIKKNVLQISPNYLTPLSDIDDMREKIGNNVFMTVVFPAEKGKLIPVGIVWAKDLRKSVLGTVTMRDFCNLDEVKMASYLNVISVIDHHKTSLNTSITPFALIGDAQSCNVLIAEQALALNERYSFSGMTPSSINQQIAEHKEAKQTEESNRNLRRLLQRKIILNNLGKYYVHPKREFLEYLFYIHATLDDTDLLSKVSSRDVECIVKLLNHMKTLTSKKEVEIINLDGIPRDEHFAKNAAQKILQNEEMYSLYSKIYTLKEGEIESLLKRGSSDDLASLLVDTKEQNGCCRIGQTKIFNYNIESFTHISVQLQQYWHAKALEINTNRSEIDLHIHMISTITSAEEVYTGTVGKYEHRDEIWFWAASQLRGYEHLTLFLNKFKNAPEVIDNELELELLGGRKNELRQIFEENLPQAKIVAGKSTKKVPPIGVLRFRAGSLNSRKSMVSPYLPQLIS